MKRLFSVVAWLWVLMPLTVVSCEDEETYADQKEREAEQINKWLSNNNIDVISMQEFLKDTVTNNPDTGPNKELNEYVLFEENGVYMQIVRRGMGKMIQPNETWNYNARYVERYIGTGDTMSMNLFQQDPDKFYVERTGDNFTASFSSGIMSIIYGNSVPSSWLMPFSYIMPGVLNGDQAAKVRLIVPHNQGTQTAATKVYPSFYEIIITAQKWQW